MKEETHALLLNATWSLNLEQLYFIYNITFYKL